MKKRNNQRRRTVSPPAIIAAVILLLGASASVFAQSKTADDDLAFSSAKRNLRLTDSAGKFDVMNLQPNALFAAHPKADNDYPKPDFSAISDYYELVNYKYDFPRPYLKLTVKLKKDIGQYDSFSVHFFDEDGAEVEYTHGQPALGEFGRAGDVKHTEVGAPLERDMPKVKTVVFRREIN